MMEYFPISGSLVGEVSSRLTALLVSLVTLVFLVTREPLVPLMLGADFSLRVFAGGLFSPLRYASAGIVRVLGIEERKIDAAPKRFAAALGFTLMALTVLAEWWGSGGIALILAGVLLTCALLESVMNVCLGCKVYMLMSRFSWS